MATGEGREADWVVSRSIVSSVVGSTISTTSGFVTKSIVVVAASSVAVVDAAVVVDVVVAVVVVAVDVVEVVGGDVEAVVSTHWPSTKRSAPPGHTTLRHLLKKGSKSSPWKEVEGG